MFRMTIGRWASLGVVLFAAAACNMVSGAEDVSFTNDDDDGGGLYDGLDGQGAAGGGTTVGVTAGPGSGGATTAATTVSAVASSSSSGSDPCEYPAGPYGVSPGQVVPPTISWQGYAAGSAASSTIALSDFFDCDGSKGINAILIDTSKYF